MKYISLSGYKVLRSTIFSVVAWVMTATPTFAASTLIDPNKNNEMFQTDLGTIITSVVNIAIILGAIAALFFLVVAAIEWITSGGDKAKYESARSRITMAVIGLALLAITFIVWKLIMQFLNLDSSELLGIGE